MALKNAGNRPSSSGSPVLRKPTAQFDGGILRVPWRAGAPSAGFSRRAQARPPAFPYDRKEANRMSRKPCVRSGNALVVFEGEARLIWEKHVRHHVWRATGLWPSDAERAEIDHHLDKGRPLLVLLDQVEAVVPVLPEEVTAMPVLLALARFASGVGDVDIPFLDWLPAPLRERARAFMDRTETELRVMPRAVRPPVVVSCPDPRAPHVRFARRTGPAALSDAALAELVGHVFPPHRPGGCVLPPDHGPHCPSRLSHAATEPS